VSGVFGVVEALVGPFFGQGAVESLYLAVGLRVSDPGTPIAVAAVSSSSALE